MVFGIRRNFTFIAKLGKHSIEFSYGFLEEIINITATPPPVNAIEPEDIGISLQSSGLSKNKFLNVTSVIFTSTLSKDKIIGVIRNATPNLIV